MGHIISMLTFPAEMKRERIQAECDEWGNSNCDLMERGGRYGGLGSPVQFKDKLFEDYDSAQEYLAQTTGSYMETAVKYKEYPRTQPSKAMEDLNRRIKEYNERIQALNIPHYQGAKQATVKCKCCGSSHATKFCGNTYRNNCPVCRSDLRPQSTLERIESYKSKLKDLEKRLKEEEGKQNRKNGNKVSIRWMVCCEVHY